MLTDGARVRLRARRADLRARARPLPDGQAIGIKVPVFSLGFGPRLVGRPAGDTEYRLSAVPLGGYVKMAGENPDEPAQRRDDEFLSKSKWQRFQVLIMGPAMNILLAVVLMAVVLSARGARSRRSRRAAGRGGGRERVAGRARRRQARRSDRQCRRPAGRHLGAASRHRRTRAPGETGSLVLLRDGREITVPVTPTAADELRDGRYRRLPDVHPRVRSVMPGDPAEQGRHQAGRRRAGRRRRADHVCASALRGHCQKANTPITLSDQRDGPTQRGGRLTPSAGARSA